MNFSDEIKKISLNVFLILGAVTVFLYIYKRTNPYSFTGLDERFLATALLLFGFLSIIFHIKEILTYVHSLKSIKFSSEILIPSIAKTQISYVVYFLLILAVSFVLIFFSSKFLFQLGDLIPYFILIYLFISLILKLDSRIPIAFALLLLLLTATTLVQGLENAANQIAIYAYYFLVAGVMLQLIEYIRNPETEVE